MNVALCCISSGSSMFAKVSVYRFQVFKEVGPIVQWVTNLTANQGVAKFDPSLVQGYEFPILSWGLVIKKYLWSFSSFRRFKTGCCLLHVHKVLVNRLVKLVQEKSVVR